MYNFLGHFNCRTVFLIQSNVVYLSIPPWVWIDKLLFLLVYLCIPPTHGHLDPLFLPTFYLFFSFFFFAFLLCTAMVILLDVSWTTCVRVSPGMFLYTWNCSVTEHLNFTVHPHLTGYRETAFQRDCFHSLSQKPYMEIFTSPHSC